MWKEILFISWQKTLMTMVNNYANRYLKSPKSWLRLMNNGTLMVKSNLTYPNHNDSNGKNELLMK